ncbi:hypothetical protein KF707_13060 [Candidatus Obscuribacterales bacterium]|nr:hypothetical protein [Candidatus Obscuribacterales bacterium]
MNRKISRKPHGNMLVLMIAFTATIVLALLFFALGFVRLTGTQFEQKTAIEAAALAAARDMSNIVITNNDFGYVGLSDSAPVGAGTQAGDSYYTQVHGLNTLVGTTLLDYIIADELGVDEMKRLAQVDWQHVKTAGDQLQAELTRCTAAGQTAFDKDGLVLNPYKAAEDAYRANQVRMTGKSNYKAGSMVLNLGTIDGMVTNIKTPAGWTNSFNSGATKGGYYVAYKPVNFDGHTWVFAGVGDAMRLVDPSKFRNAATGVPWQVKTIVRAEAVQQLNDDGIVANTKSVACAQPASVFDPKPAPGALVVSFPDGPPNGPCTMAKVFDLYSSCLSDGDDDSDVYMAKNGDYPVDATSSIVPDPNWPIPSDPGRQAANADKIAVYDWLKRAGTKADVASVVGMHSWPFNPASPATVNWPPGGAAGAKPIPNGVAHIYRFNPNGTVNYQSKNCLPAPFYIVSDQQMLVESFEAISQGANSTLQVKPIDLGPPIMDSDGEVNLTTKFDLYIRDYARRPGTLKGGQHSGEPMDDPLVSYKKEAPKVAIQLTKDGTGIGTNTQVRFGGIGAKPKGPGSGDGQGSLPLILPQEDFAFYWTGSTMQLLRDPSVYKSYTPGSGLRPTYRTNGVVCDIRMRRQVQVRDETTVEIPVTDPTTGSPVVDPVTGLPTTTSSTTSTKSDVGYIGIK